MARRAGRLGGRRLVPPRQISAVVCVVEQADGLLLEQAPTPAVLVKGSRPNFTQTVFKGIAVLAVEESDPARLLAKIFENAVIFLSEDPDRLPCMAARQSKH